MGFIFILAIGGVGLYLWLKSARQNQGHWRDAAERLGLSYFPGDMVGLGRIAGRKGGHRIEITTYSRSHGKTSSVYTQYTIHFHVPISTDFKIVRQNALHKLGAFLGLKDIEVGDPAFDDRVLLRGKSPDQIIEFLNAERRRAILRLLNSYDDIELSNGHIELSKPGRDTAPAILFNTTRQLLSVANELTDNSPSIAKEAEQMVEIEPIEPLCNPLFSANPIVPEPPMVEVEEDAVIGEEISESNEPNGFDESGEADERAVESPEPPPPPIAAPIEPLPAAISHDLLTVAQDLYGGDSSMAYKTQPRFEEVYLDQQVFGTGKIQRVSKYSYDTVFKDSEGVKVTCDICELSGAYSTVKVKADIIFPSERFEELKNQIDSSISIAGKLVAHKSVLHHLYIVSE